MSAPAEPDHVDGCDSELRARLIRLLDTDDVDAAIDAGLMQYVPCPACDSNDAQAALDSARIRATQRRLTDAWAARDRYHARNARLQRREAERAARRAPARAHADPRTPSLPPAAAAALARAKAKAASKP
ncbi:hypothetical protein [Luteimonas panaciterrae]|uniref:hypothetical protein n=1 Tax=Luteimonas panaciterrae TaxID=363885 RepID=UPI001CFA8D5F|nr:hypothetical protein [Luteimonas panaciterrae]